MASQCLALKVRRLGRVVTRIYDAALAEHGIGIAQLNLMTAIACAGGARPAELARFLEVEKSTLSRDLKRLEELGWVQGDSAGTRRGRPVTLTPAGSRLLLEVWPAWKKAQATARAELGRGQFARLHKLLEPQIERELLGSAPGRGR